jgi:hypothetical protein
MVRTSAIESKLCGLHDAILKLFSQSNISSVHFGRLSRTYLKLHLELTTFSLLQIIQLFTILVP